MKTTQQIEKHTKKKLTPSGQPVALQHDLGNGHRSNVEDFPCGCVSPPHTTFDCCCAPPLYGVARELLRPCGLASGEVGGLDDADNLIGSQGLAREDLERANLSTAVATQGIVRCVCVCVCVYCWTLV